MVIGYFYMFRAGIRPAKADTPLVVNTNAVLTGAVTGKGFKAIAGRYPQIIKTRGDFKLSKLAPRNLSDVLKPADSYAPRERFSIFTLE